MNASILVVEDNDVLRLLLIKLLQKCGVPLVDGAIHGGDAVDRFKANRDYRLILMDIMMPEVDGLQATMQIRELELSLKLNRVAIIGITAMDNETDCLAAGMDGYYRKPLLAEQLKEIIEKWLP